MRNPEPILSVVATSRNDDHGGNLLARMQVFVDGFVAQCQRHNVTAELILVEWNPPAGRAALAEALKWPSDPGPAQLRIVTVPRDVHARFTHSEKLPLFQMIAKNAGIRRARGQFILATNIDILFSDAVVEFMRNSLRPGRLYRADRCDVPPDFPGATIGERLGYCERAYFRINARGGTLVKRGGKWARQRDPAHLPFFARLVRRIFRLPKRLLHWIIRLANALYRGSLQVAVAKLLRGLTRIQIISNRLPWTFGLAVRRAWRLYDRLFGYLRPLHTNGCGDFTLMAREDWRRLRGYPEWHMFSWHIDSVLLHQARAMAIEEVDLPADFRIFHIEHAHGSGYTPEGAGSLFSRLRAAGIPYLNYQDFLALIEEMPETRRSGQPVLYNPDDWGLANTVLREARPSALTPAVNRSNP